MKIKDRVLYYRRLIYFYMPDYIKSIISRRSDSLNKKMEHYRKIAKENKITKDNVCEILDSLNIKTDILLHSSEINIGKFLFKKEELVDILIDRVNIREHTLMAASLSFSEGMYNYVVKNTERVFDVKTAPIMTGVLNEIIANRPGVIRSLHPSHSVVAIGNRALYYTENHEMDETPFARNSPWWKIIESNGCILLFGAPKNITSIHAVEDAIGNVYPWKIYLKKKYAFDVIDVEGIHHTVLTTCHNPATSIRRTHLPDFIQELKKNGLWNSKPIGASEIVLLSAKGMALTYLNWVEKGYSIYGKHKVTHKLVERIEDIKSELSRQD